MSFRKKYQKEYNIKTTKTALFMLPTLGIPLETYKGIIINVFTTENLENPEIILIFDNSIGDHLLPLLIKKIRNHPNFIEDWMDDDNKEICVKFRVSSDYKDDYYKMMSGDYSKFSRKLKELLFSPGFYKKTIAKDESDEFGLPAKSIFEVVYLTQNKIEELEESLGCKLTKAEILDRPDKHEYYKSIKTIRKEYEKTDEVKREKRATRSKRKKQL